MKKSDLSIGLHVENHYGRRGTVIAIGGWKKNPSSWGYKTEPLAYDGHEFKVRGDRTDRDAAGIVVAWDDNWGTASIESTRSVFPIGTYAANQEALAARVAAEAEERRNYEASLLFRLNDVWGEERAAAIRTHFRIPSDFPLNTDQRDVLRTAIAIGEVAG